MNPAGRPTKAKQGQRQREALQAIADFINQQTDWNVSDLARVLGMDRQQARSLIATLTLRGHLAPGEVLVKKQLPVITPAGLAHVFAADQQAA